MDWIIEKKLDEDIFSNEFEYFFSFLTDRFEYATELWKAELEKKFNKKFKPIWILSAKPSELFQKDNYIIINKELIEIKNKLKSNNIIYLQDYEDLNKEFLESESIKELIYNLVHKQDRIFILPFTTSFLNVSHPKAIVLGPKTDVATFFDDKTEHIKLFEKLDLPRNKVRVYKNIEEIKKSESYPLWVSAAYTSGANESKIVYSDYDLDSFFLKLRDINKTKGLLVANLIVDVFLSPNVNAIVCGEQDTRIICITDQILRGLHYLGNVYPSDVNEEQKNKIIEITKSIGDYLSKLGYRGLFGLDFIIDSKGNISTTDLNPRRQGGYLCNVLMSKKINIPEMELKLALGEKVPEFDYKDFQADFVWAHSKIKPYFYNVRITNSLKENEPQNPFSNIGTCFKAIFYPKNNLLIDGNAGYIILSNNNNNNNRLIRSEIIKNSEVLLSKSLELYPGFSIPQIGTEELPSSQKAP